MEKTIITFSANEQRLIKTGGIECYASNIVSYIEAHFDLGANWSGYDSVRAVWSNDNNMTVISTVLDSNGVCVVPFEVLKTKGIVKVNLVGSISVSDVLTDRLTSFPCEAVKVTAKAKIEGSETAPITPSQFEQFVAAVISEVEKVTGMTAQAETLPAGSQATARYENGILYLGIPQGIQGERGETGADGNGIASVVYNADYSLTLVFDNGERFTTPPIRGERGPAGADGTDGRDGADGVTPSLSVGTVTTLPSTEDAYVTRTGTDENPVFNFGIPQGPKGDTGEVTMSQLSALLPTDTASGSIASFPDGTDLFPALSVKVDLEPIQSGSGTPSPDNVRPISGHTECVTIVSPTTDAEDGTSYTTTLGRTVYGGTLDVVSGELVVDRAMVDLGSLSWGISDGMYEGVIADRSNGEAICSNYPFYGTAYYTDIKNNMPDKQFGFTSTSSRRYIEVRDSSYSTASDFKTAMDGVQLVYELATPQTYQLDPQTIDLLLGQNNVWTDCGSVEVTYKADVGLYIDKKLSSNGTRSLSMGLTKSATAEAETETEPSKTEADTKTEEAETEETKTETDKTDTETR